MIGRTWADEYVMKTEQVRLDNAIAVGALGPEEIPFRREAVSDRTSRLAFPFLLPYCLPYVWARVPEIRLLSCRLLLLHFRGYRLTLFCYVSCQMVGLPVAPPSRHRDIHKTFLRSHEPVA